MDQTPNPYQRIFNNLLQIKRGDLALFVNINKTKVFDLTTEVSAAKVGKIIEKPQFKIHLQDSELQKWIYKARVSANWNDLEQINQKYLKRDSVTLEGKFSRCQQQIVQELENNFQKRIKRWRIFEQRSQDIWTDEGIYPLHIGTLLISVRLPSDKVIYAPMFVKRVQLTVQKQTVTLQPLDAEEQWRFNEKLKFILENNDLTPIPALIDATNNLKEKINVVNQWLQTTWTIDQLPQPCCHLKRDNINHKHIKLSPGVILGLMNPYGGGLRNLFKEIVRQNQVDQILQVDFDQTKYAAYIDKCVADNRQIIEIHKMNFQQKKALISSLNQNTVIWGPPGTGKSQVITNLIVNILVSKKWALVCSRKKSALDVLSDRLGILKKFCFFVNSKVNNRYRQFNKKDFYQPLQQVVNLIEKNEFAIEQTKKRINTKILPATEYQAVQVFLTKYQSHGRCYEAVLEILKVYPYYHKLIPEYHQYLEQLKNLDLQWPVPTKLFNSQKEYTKQTARLNNIHKKIFRYPRSFTKATIKAYACHQLKPRFNLNTILDRLKFTDSSTINQIIKHKDALNFTNDQNVNTQSVLIATERLLGQAIREKIKGWQRYQRYNYANYKKFASAVRAGRLLPWTFWKKHQQIINQLFQIFITTPEGVHNSWHHHHFFDYLIVDEASQMFTELGLPLMWMAKIKIIAGDHQQLQPTSWFETRDYQKSDSDTPEDANSLLDYARDKGVYQLMLNKNYRSKSAALMSFSAKHFYQDKLDVINDCQQLTKRSVEVVNCPEGKWEDGVNRAEATKVLDICLDYLPKPCYQKIIILTFNKKQKDLVEDTIFNDDYRYQAISQKLKEKQILIKNIENIQGDEAELVIMSVVYDPTTYTAGTYVARTGGKNALNVAISRAKIKNIVVKSVTASNIRHCRSDDFQIFQQWLKFIDMPSQEQLTYTKPIIAKTDSIESQFETEVVNYFKKHIKFNPKFPDVVMYSQYPVGSLKIDLVFTCRKEYVLGVEVDGCAYHSLSDYWHDRDRQDYLEAKGYNIRRIKEIDWVLNKRQVTKDIRQKLITLIIEKFNLNL